VNISGGLITIQAMYTGICTFSGDVVISGGDLVVSSQRRASISGSYGGVTITGGNLALTSGVASVVFGDTGVTVAGGAELPAGVVVEQDEYDDFFLSMEEGETLFIRTPFSAELKQDGIHLTNSPWDLAVMIISYDADGRIIDIQMEVTPDGVVTPAVTGNTVTAFFVNSRSIPLDSALPIP